jgi:hypothetical protein
MDGLNVNSDGGRVPQVLTHFSQESIFIFTLRRGWCGLCGAALMVHLERPRVRPDLRWRLRIHSDEITLLRGKEDEGMLSTLPFECCWPQLAARWWEVLCAACEYLDVSPYALKRHVFPRDIRYWDTPVEE